MLLVGFNLYTLVEPDPNAERPVPETAVPPVGERPAPGTPGTLSAGEPSKAKTPERRSFEDASERAAGRDGIEGLSAEKIPTKEIASKTVTLNVRPKTASVYQDGKFLGKGSRTLLLSGSSASKIRGKAAGYLTKPSQWVLPPQRRFSHLNPAGKGSVQFRFFPANAVIRLDGKRLDAQGANLVQRELRLETTRGIE